MKITSEQIEFFKEAEKLIRKGYYPSGQKAIENYKAIFAEEIAKGTMTSNLNPKCGGCIRTAVQKTYEAIIKLEKQLENDKQGTEKEDK